MSSNAVANPPAAPAESKSARKKRAKAAAATAATVDAPASVAASDTRADTPNLEPSLNGNRETASAFDGAEDLPVVKELQKNIRNLNKKLNAMSKVDSIVAAHPDLSLDDLVATRKINVDQRTQALKKPDLVKSLALAEEQLALYKQMQQWFEDRLEAEKAKFNEEMARVQASCDSRIEAMRASCQDDIQGNMFSFNLRLLTLTRFLRAAAARRQSDADETDVKTQAFEGLLLSLYGGDSASVFAAEKLINGSNDLISAPDGTVLDITYTQIRDVALQETPYMGAALFPTTDPSYPLRKQTEEEDIARWAAKAAAQDDAAVTQAAVQTDPTLTHAGLTEIDTATHDTQSPPPNETVDLGTAPASASTADFAANAAGADRWDSKAPGSDDPLAESYEIIPRPDSQVESAHHPAQRNSTLNWADESADAMAAQNPVNGGFQEVRYGATRGRGGYAGPVNTQAGYQWQSAPSAPANARQARPGGTPSNQQMRGNGSFGGGRGGSAGGASRGPRGGAARGARGGRGDLPLR